LTSLSALIGLIEEREQGPSPGFGVEHALLTFLIIGESGNIGRQALARRLELGEGSMRTVLRRLGRAGYLRVDRSGCHLTSSGQRLFQTISRRIGSRVALGSTALTVGKSQVAIIVRTPKPVGKGIEQRDSAIKAGASGATTYLIRAGKFTIPGGSSDCEKDYPSQAWSMLREKLKPKSGDAVIVCGAPEERMAELGALSAALTLL
jgi:hypothetical protein